MCVVTIMAVHSVTECEMDVRMCVHDNVCCHTSHMTLFPSSESACYGVHNIITMLSGAHNEKREREREGRSMTRPHT